MKPDGESVTNGDAAATCEAKVPALVARLYIRDGHKFRLLPIKPWKWESGQNNRGLRVSRGILRHFRIRRSLSLSPSLSSSSLSLPRPRDCSKAASPRTFLTTHTRFFRSLVPRFSSPSSCDGAARALDVWKNRRDTDRIARASVKFVIWLRTTKVADYSVGNCVCRLSM